jgi:hypothetical protein
LYWLPIFECRLGQYHTDPERFLSSRSCQVEVERDGRRELVGVETGLFADGQVEVSGRGLAAGDRVVVPA